MCILRRRCIYENPRYIRHTAGGRTIFPDDDIRAISNIDSPGTSTRAGFFSSTSLRAREREPRWHWAHTTLTKLFSCAQFGDPRHSRPFTNPLTQMPRPWLHPVQWLELSRNVQRQREIPFFTPKVTERMIQHTNMADTSFLE